MKTTPRQIIDPAADTRGFRDALSCFATGVTIVTTMTPDGPIGITANSFASVSLDPPLVLWSPAKASKRFAAFEAAQYFAIHVLTEDQQHICEGFAKNKSAFEGLDWGPASNGTPLIENCLARFECNLHAAHEGGDHVIIVGHVHQAEARLGRPLMFQSGQFVGLQTT